MFKINKKILHVKNQINFKVARGIQVLLYQLAKSYVYAIYFCNKTNSITLQSKGDLWSLKLLPRIRPACLSVFAACSGRPAMAQPDSAAKKSAGVSHFLVGSVSEENSEDEIQGKADVQLEEKEPRSLSPSSGSSDSTYEMGFENIEGPTHNLRLGNLS